MANRLDEPLRLLHVSPSFYPAVEYGGPVASLYALSLAQQRAGLLVKVLTSTAGLTTAAQPKHRELSGWVAEFGVPTYYAPVRLPPDLAPAMVPELVRLCRWAEVVHITGLFSAASILALATALTLNLGRSARRAIVLSPRGALLPWALAQGRSRARKQQFLTALAPLLRRVHGWHVTSEEEAVAVRAVLSQLGASQANIQVVAPGVVSSGEGRAADDDSDDQSDYVVSTESPRPLAGEGQGEGLRDGTEPSPHLSRKRARGLAAFYQQKAGHQILVLGRIHPVKNIELAIDSLALLRRDFPEASLVIAGPAADDRYVAKLRAQAEALGLSAAITWPGLITGATKQRVLAASAALWLCSHMESFGNVVVEALAEGTPVVAAQTTPWALLEQAAVGHWVPPQPEAFASATRELLTSQLDAAARQKQTARCQQLVHTHFSWQHAEQKMRQLYLSALQCSTST